VNIQGRPTGRVVWMWKVSGFTFSLFSCYKPHVLVFIMIIEFLYQQCLQMRVYMQSTTQGSK